MTRAFPVKIAQGLLNIFQIGDKNKRSIIDLMKNTQFWKNMIFLVIGIFIGFMTHPSTPAAPLVINIPPAEEIYRDSLVSEVDKYITSSSPRSNLSAEVLVDLCLQYDFDITFALAQGQIESGLGVYGASRRTSSVWNVGHYDNMSTQDVIRSGRGYAHPDESIEPYIVLVKNKYLGNRRTVDDLLRNYTSLSGHRYASDGTYEVKLRATYNQIKQSTNIYKLFYQIQDLS